MKLILSIVLFSLFQSNYSFANSNQCTTDADCLAKYQVCRGGKCVWLRTDDEELFMLGVESAYQDFEAIPGKNCAVCIVKLGGETICKDDGKPIGDRGCVRTIYE